MNVIGEVKGRTCIIQDDIIDTGGTMQNAAQALMESAAERVWACAVHGSFRGRPSQRIEQSGQSRSSS